MSSNDHPITASEARALFTPWRDASALVLAVSGGPDSTALMWLAARWRRGRKAGPRLLAVTVDHQLRATSAAEARAVKRLAATLGLPHRTLRWSGPKPRSGVPEAARAARYRLLAKAAAAAKASHVLTAHTGDDQAETVLMRLTRGSGLSGLAAMAVETPRDGVILARPFLGLAKSRLVATLTRAGIAFVDDPLNADPRYTRPRLRALLAALTEEGFDARALARLAERLARADAALERMADGAERYLTLHNDSEGFDTRAFAALPDEMRLRLLRRALTRAATEGAPKLGKTEALLRDIDAATAATPQRNRPFILKRTLAGALVTLSPTRLTIGPAPPRRSRRTPPDSA